MVKEKTKPRDIEEKISFKNLYGEFRIGRRVIQPSDINLTSGLCSTFGKAEVEKSAVGIIRFFKSKGQWISFSLLELLDFYKKDSLDQNEIFFGLLCPWEDDGMFYTMLGETSFRLPPPYFVVSFDYKYMATDLFIKKCLGENNQHLIKIA